MTYTIELTKVCKEKDEIDNAVFNGMIESALKGLLTFDKAHVGDKIFMDMLVPAIKVYESAIKSRKDFKGVLEDLKGSGGKRQEIYK